ncbi:MAG: Crp/Fnr family transcriptional regulator [Campylobacterales bacterium]|nr:Crp/Fnr family transcriptional regulator [Campylobacterales bacterium]
MIIDNKQIFESLKKSLDSYHIISQDTWNKFINICSIRTIKKNEYAFDVYDKVDCISFIYSGLFRSCTTNENAQEYNKNFFWEGRFFGPMITLLNDFAVEESVQALEDSIVIDINHKKYRELLYEKEDIKLFYILYLEKHWILEKDKNAQVLVLENAQERYINFLKVFNHIVSRLSQYHIALYLGISPTHLSRIKKEIKGTAAMALS